jgi:excisionase family DNA binding protein
MATEGAIDISHLRPLLSFKQAAEAIGLTESCLRDQVNRGHMAYVTVGKRRMIPRDALPKFISDHTVMPCPEETPDRVSASSKNEGATTSHGPSPVARGSAARARQIAAKLKSSSQSSSGNGSDGADRVIHLKSS